MMPESQSADLDTEAISNGAGSGQFVVEPFCGSNDSLQSFVVSTWSEAYAGKMTFPVWSKDYFDWQFAARNGEPDRRLAVYDDGRLVAALLGTPANFKTDSMAFHGAHWSWLSVARSHRGYGLATLLDEARVELEKKAGSDLIVSYRFTGSKHSLAEQPSNRFPLKKFHSRIGFWARPLDGKRLQKWNPDRVEGFLSRLTAPLLPAVNVAAGAGIRSFERDDLDDCLKVTEQHSRNSALCIDWDGSTLLHQLNGSAVPQTIVAVHDGHVRGFLNFHLLPFQGATLEPVAIIDMICVSLLPAGIQSALLKQALQLMRDQGAILALKTRCGDVPSSLLFRAGFIPRLPDSTLVLQWTQSVQNIPRNRPLHLLWR